MSSSEISILLVEDNVGDAGLLRAALVDVVSDDFRFTLVHATKLAEAVGLLEEARFDVVLLDLSLPDSQGVATVQGIRRVVPEIPIVILSGLSDERVAIEAMRNGAQDYLVKGQVDSAMLVRSIRYAVERQTIESELVRQRERQLALQEINLAITSTLNLRALLDHLLQTIQRLLPEFTTTVHLKNPNTGGFETLACGNIDAAAWERSIPEKVMTQAMSETKIPFALVDGVIDPGARHREFFERHGFVSYLGCPLIVKEKLIGLLSFFSRERQTFNDSETEFFKTLAGQTAVAIQNCQLYEQIKTAHDVLEHALEIKSTLVGVMAHEIKNPIQVIMGTANLLAADVFGELTAEQRTRIGAIEAGALELSRLIQSALDMARLDRGQMILRTTEVCVGTLLTELRAEFEGVFLRKSLELNIVLPQSGVTMTTDDIKLKEILRNLIENARKYTHQGRVEVAFQEKDAERVEFRVRDTGIGIPRELLPKIFDLFYQVDGAARDHASAGLGLNIVKRLVEAMSGEIVVDSEVAKGTSFCVTLPRTIQPTPSH